MVANNKGIYGNIIQKQKILFFKEYFVE